MTASAFKRGGSRMVSYERFKYALSNLDGRKWRMFEILANAFLASEFSSLRPMASASGDDGLDASLFQPSDDAETAIQYSVRKDWQAKIKETCERIKETFPDTSVIIYATNQVIGATANELRKAVRKDYGFYLDIRDQEWFLTQRNAGARNSAEADEFCSNAMDIRSIGSDAIDKQAQALTDLETKAAFVYLKLQWADDTRDKGLTKVCFEALVRSVLRDTSSDDRMSRQQIKDQISVLLPAHDSDELSRKIDAALRKLSKVYIRHWTKIDEFCLTNDERERLAERLAEISVLDDALTAEIRSTMLTMCSELSLPRPSNVDAHVSYTRKLIEKILLGRGEVFATAVTKNQPSAFVSTGDIDAVVRHEMARSRPPRDLEPRLVVAVIQSALMSATDDVRKYLRSLSDTYTLFAFLRETPDVQSAIVKIFSDADLWLDTNVVLPLLAETLMDDHARSYTSLLNAAVESDLRLYITEGVLEELATHVTRCRSYFRALTQSKAEGSPPYLLAMYAASGRPMGFFTQWLEHFAGTARMEDDIADYLEELHHIRLNDLSELAGRAETLYSTQISEVYREARESKEKRNIAMGLPAMDPGTTAKLVRHDVVQYVGIVMRRQTRNERRESFGYKSWWLTFDGKAHRMNDELKDRVDGRLPASPAISPDFMVHYLAVGPVRSRISRRTEETLPLMMNMSALDAVPPDLIELAEQLRRELGDLPAHVVSRKIRDTLDEARFLLGPLALGGEGRLTDEIKSRLIVQAKRR